MPKQAQADQVTSGGPSWARKQQGNVTVATFATYPGLQWYNGSSKMKKVGGVAAYGGFVVKQSVVPDSWPLGTQTEWVHTNGETSEIWEIGAAELAVIASRTDWFFGTKDHPEWVDKYQIRGKLKPKARNRYLVLLRGAEESQEKPLQFTQFGVNGLLFWREYQDYQKKVYGIAQKLMGTKPDNYTFWMRVEPGPEEKASKNYDSRITPPKVVYKIARTPGNLAMVTFDDKDPAEYLEAAYIGDVNMDMCAQWWEQAQDWLKEKASGGAGGGSDEAGTVGGEDELDLGGDNTDGLPF